MTWAIAALALVWGLATPTPSWGKIIHVDDDGLDCFAPEFATVAEAITAADDGDDILVCPGIYTEQLVINKHLSLSGLPSGSRLAVIRPLTLPYAAPSLQSGNPVTAAIIVQALLVRIQNLEVDLSANNLAGCSPALAGIYLRNTIGSVRGTYVHGVRIPNRPECESGVAIYAESGQNGVDRDGNPLFGITKVASESNTLADYQKAGLVGSGGTTSVSVLETEALGSGPIAGPAQYGFQLSMGARGRIRDSAAMANASTITDILGSGVLFFAAQRSKVRRMTIDGGDVGLFLTGDRHRAAGTVLTNIRSDGIVLLGNRNKAGGNDLDGASVAGAYLDGNTNVFARGAVANTPVGIWNYAGEGNRVRGIKFREGVVEQIRLGGTRTLTVDSVMPFQTSCSNDVACDDGNDCTTDTCNTGTGACQHSNLPDGTTCDDNEQCTTGDTCNAGFCVGTPEADGTVCDDGRFCVTNDACLAGVCTGVPNTCDDANACTFDTCDEAGDQCVSAAEPDGTPCADGDLCNGNESCQAGTCVDGPDPDCDDVNLCTADSCDALSGCAHPAVPDGTSCSDGDSCNGDETCTGGVCDPGTPPCDDGDPCTTDTCDVNGCANTPVSDGTPCADATVCNGDETCQAGTCTPGTPLTCGDSDPCTADTCDPVAGCQAPPAPDGTACPDTDLCNGDETCQGGSCTPAAGPLVCDDGNPCTTDACDALNGCGATDVADGTPCPDGDTCNGDELCAGGVCQPGGGPNCNDGNPCTTDGCDTNGCLNPNVSDGTPCADATVCNGDEVCTGGTCGAGTPLNCVDGLPCTLDNCDPVGGCQNPAVPDGTSCADATVCNGDEVCTGGACGAGTPLNCVDGLPCTLDNCDPLAGCQNPAVPDGTSCADATVCNGDEVCTGGTCGAGSPLNCVDGLPCTLDNCDPVGGCQNPAVPDGTSCADATVCNGDEVCTGGTCGAGTPLNCVDGLPCTLDNCDPLAGCQNPAVPDGTSCADATVCNGDEVCTGGACGAGTPLDCDDLEECTTDTCDALNGCDNAPLPDGTSCSLGSCTGGVCG